MAPTSLAELKELWRMEEVRSMSRRYFMSNGFDGTLSSIGIGVGSYLSGVSSGLTVFKVGVGAAVGLATSGIWSVWEIERAEKLAKLHDTEDAMLRDLKDTKIFESLEGARFVNAAMSGLGPVIGILLPVLPFLFAPEMMTMLTATVTGVGVGMLLLFGFGIYMARISNQTWWKVGLRVGVAGLVVALINVMLPG